MATHAARGIHLKTPLGKDVLLPRSVLARERLSEPFRFDLDVVSEKEDINPDDLLGKAVCLSYELPSGGSNRFFHGLVTEFMQTGYRGRFHEYRAIVRPWFWLLTKTADCRIFQQKTVPQIFQEVVKHYGFTDYKLKLKGSYEPWEYCVQYRETDFNFLSRLLEQEGIYYYFEHTDAAHSLVLADDASAHQSTPHYESVPFYPPDTVEAQRERDHLTAWSFSKSMQTGAYATTDFDFEKPRQSLLSAETISRSYSHSSFEVFDYPAELAKLAGTESHRISKMRIEELQSSYMLARGEGNAAGLATGRRFKLAQYPRTDLNIEYLITGTEVTFSSDPYQAGAQDEDLEFNISLDAISAKTPFRPRRNTPKPAIYGAQTAMVVGPGGEEIYTDEYGRVKVQFHWDRYGKLDENSSCWVRVAQVWAGKSWGAIHIPRIGQEVIVSFLEGDPDQPIITGRVYNGDSMPPYALPANKTQSGIKSRSSKGGAAANFNEIRFEDKKGSEQLFIHAEKNQDIEVENDETHWVGHDRTRKVDHDESVTVKRDRTMTIERDKTETVLRNKTVQVVGNQSENIGGAMSIVVAKTLTESVLINYAETVGGAMELTVGAALAITVGAAMSEAVGGTKSEAIGGSKSESTGGDKTLQVGKNLTETIKENQTVSVGKDLKESIEGQQVVEVKKEAMLKAKKVQITAEDEINFKTGDAEITMKKNGDITIKGGKISIKGSGDVIIKGSKIAEN